MKTITFQLTEQQVNTIAAGLAELPFKQAQPVLVELQRQYEAQRVSDVAGDLTSHVVT